MQNKLPTIHGLSPSKLYLPNLKEIDFVPNTVFEFLCIKFSNVSQDEWQRRFDDNLVFAKIHHQFINLDSTDLYVNFQNHTIFYYRHLTHEVKVPFDYQIIFENNRFMVIDKPHFLTMTPTGSYVKETLLTRLKNDTGIDDLTPIHRLDRETAGLVLFCKDKNYRNVYQSLFANHQIKKVYHAIAPFNQDLKFPIELKLHLERSEPFYTMKVGNNAPNSHTMINLLEVDEHHQWAKYELHPTTGKLHQLRVHLSHLGIAIKNDPYYPIINHKANDDFNNPLQLLACLLQFIDPISKETYAFYSKQTLTFSRCLL